MILSRNSFFISILLFASFNTNANTVNQYFIKISPNQEKVKCGNLVVGKFSTSLKYFTINGKTDTTTVSEAINMINDSISEVHNNNSKVLFFIHGFWGSLPYARHWTAKEFKTNYFKNDSSSVVAVIHIIWDASRISYKQSIKSIAESSKTLFNILNSIEKTIIFRSSLMCHSMGNRFLHKTISTYKVNVHFDELILMAPDLDYRKFEEDISLFTSIASTVDVFYNTKDQTLNLSKRYNEIERLGQMNKYHNKENIIFIDCTNIGDIKSVFDYFNNHLYFLTSKTVKAKVEKILQY